MAYREIEDANGVHWKVWDTVPSSGANVRVNYASGWLTFESEIERRRVSPIPDGWESAEDAMLCSWLHHAPVIQPAHLGELVERVAPAPAAEAPEPEEVPLAIRRAREVIRSVKRTLGV